MGAGSRQVIRPLGPKSHRGDDRFQSVHNVEFTREVSDADMEQKADLRLGAHLSIAKGLPRTAAMAEEIGANCFQFFTRNPRGSKARKIPDTEVNRWQELQQEKLLAPMVGHFPYTVNMAAPKEETRQFAQDILAADLERMDRVGADYLVVHPGSHVSSGTDAGRQRILEALEQALLPFQGETHLLLEAMSGQGSEIGTLQDLGFFLQALDHPVNLGFCLDTCHLFAAGWEVRTRTGLEQLLEQVEQHVGLNRVRVIHLNDSLHDLGSGKDRHAKLGQGFLGREGLVNIITHPSLHPLPFILETPVEDYREYGEEIGLIREWLGGSG